MTEYIEQTTVISWRLPILEDGKLGNPEITAKYTVIKGEGNKAKYSKKKVQTELLTSVGETINL